MSDVTDMATLPARMLAPQSALEASAAKTIAGLEESSNRSEAAYQEKNAAIEAQAKGIGDQRADLKRFTEDHPFPSPNIQPGTEKPPENDPMQRSGSWASAFGIIAGVLTKTHLKGSLNAATAAMNAIRKNDMDAYQEAKDA